MSTPDGWYIQDPYVGTFSTRDPGFESTTTALVIIGILGGLVAGFTAFSIEAAGDSGLFPLALFGLGGFGCLCAALFRHLRRDVDYSVSFNATGIRFAGAGVDRMYRWDEVMAVGILTNRALAVRLYAPTESVQATSGGIFWSLTGFSANWDVVTTAPLPPIGISPLVMALRTFAGTRFRGSHLVMDQIL